MKRKAAVRHKTPKAEVPTQPPAPPIVDEPVAVVEPKLEEPTPIAAAPRHASFLSRMGF